MIILGIDPGMAETGWGVIEKTKTNPPASGQRSKVKKDTKKGSNGFVAVDYGCIKTLVGFDMPQRLLVLKKELGKIIIEHKPDCLAIEQLFFGRNSKTAMTVGQARGVIMVAAAEKNVPIFEYQGLSVKLNLSGHGRCSKSKMQDVVKKFLGLKITPRPQHAADALAVAIHHTIKKGKGKSEKKKKR